MPQRLAGPAYLDFSVNVLPELLEVVPLKQRLNVWFMQDRAPPHFRLAVREHLDATFHRRWIGWANRIPRQHRSADLTPLGCCIWSYLKSLEYAVLPSCKQRPEQSSQTIRIRLGVYERLRSRWDVTGALKPMKTKVIVFNLFIVISMPLII